MLTCKSLCSTLALCMVGMVCGSLDPTLAQSPIRINAMIELNKAGDGFAVRHDLGALKVDQEYSLFCHVKNPLGKDFEFQQIDASCECSNIKTAEHVFAVDQDNVLTIRFRTPNNANAAKFNFSFRFNQKTENAEDQKEVGFISFSSSMEGFLHLRNTTSLFSVGHDETEVATWEIPITFTAPIDPKNLVIERSDSLDDFSIEFAEKNNLLTLRLAVLVRFVNEQGITGIVTVKDNKTDAASSLEFLVVRSDVIVVSPKYLRFRRPVDDSSYFEATALIQVNRKNDQEPAEIQYATATLKDGLKAKVKLSQLAPGIYRASISIPQDALGDLAMKNTLTWKFQVGNDHFNSTTEFELKDFQKNQ